LRHNADENLSAKGAYIISPAQTKHRQATLIATGSEVSLAIKAQQKLREEKIDVAVVSMPCMEIFEEQSTEYKDQVLGSAPRIVIEAGIKFGWEGYIGKQGLFIGMNDFGASGKADELYRHFGITVEAIVDNVKKLIK